MYRERPSRLLRSVVWTRRAEPAARVYRVLPDGCLDLIWSGGSLLVAGPDTGPHLGASAPGAEFTGLRFAPGVAPTILGRPANELTDQRLPLADLWPDADVRRLEERLAESPRPGRVLEEIAVDRLRKIDPPDPAVFAIADALRSGRSVADTAEAVGFSERQLHRRSRAAFGYGPKTLARVLRMDRALALARSGMPFAAVGAAAGYADQAHLARDVRSLAGVPLRALVG